MTTPAPGTPPAHLHYSTAGRLKAKELQEMYDMTIVDTGQSDTVIVRHLKDIDGNLWTEIESRLEPPEYYYEFYCTKTARELAEEKKGKCHGKA
jgi:hypothetical protein